ncbi:stage V sporulation protein AD [Mediterraneibacter glycyrrhizinilyticus]|uniref:stage V sporulation protein AD n=1 Tax=Mediterraneibacter glycyrrhizinilyticus TaxID=342942 RepID=UPI0025A427B8|nr:stage V sporulation protein AD [Mediterraneibacter glycyrrhizinilyticus]MDM8125516.1 stage V sporulation protein AD [Mediterraneibacter glycyrrhizinilyticus]
MNRIIKGKQSLLFENAPYIVSAASVTGSKEAAGPLGKLFDMTNEDDLFGAQTWEEAESTMQKEACVLALGKAHVKADEIRYLFGGDLLRQGIATSMGVEALQIPMFGLYGACSTSGEALALAGMCAAAGYGKYMLAVTSSHFGSAEKEFRFPLGYANQRPLSAHWTVTGSGAFLVRAADATMPGTSTANNPAANIQAANSPAADLPETSAAPPAEDDISTTHVSHVRIAGVTVGKIVDYGLKDSQNMGACMAPAAMDTIVQNFEDFGRSEQDYDRIITGDLGYVGQSILFDLVRGKGYDIRKKHLDCGMTIYDQEKQDTHAGGSGCGCAAVTLASFIIPKIEKGEWKRVLFVPTGALMSTVSFNEGASVPGIAHGIVLEHWPQAQ